jgi:serine carboxypeptidase-like clade 1
MPKLKLNSGAQEMLQLPVYTGEAELHLSEISLQCRVSTKHLLAYVQLSREALPLV